MKPPASAGGAVTRNATINSNDAKRFLEWLDPEAERFTFQTFPDRSNGSGNRHALIRHGPIGKLGNELSRLNKDGNGVFVTVNETNFSGRKKENITRVRALYLDLDGAPPQPAMSSSCPPHCIVETSPGRYHCYWLVDGVSKEKAEIYTSALIRRFGGDPSCSDCSRVLRVPGFVHQKGEPFRSKIVHLEEQMPLTPEVIERDLCPNLEEAPLHHSDQAFRAPNGSLDLEEMEAALRGDVDGWHTAMLKFVMKWVRAGTTDRMIIGMLMQYRWPGYSVEETEREIQKAIDGARGKVDPQPAPEVEKENKDSKRPPFSIQPLSEFTADFVAPNYLVEGIILRNRLYSLTGKTAHGKTAVALAIAFAIGRGTPIGTKGTEQGSVLYLAAENPDDIRMRVILMCDRLEIDDAPVSFLDHGFDLQKDSDKLVKAVAALSTEFSAVFVDTGAAFLAHSQVEDENSNIALLQFALALRKLTEMPGKPAVIALMHPVKGAHSQGDLLPRGGGAFLNEVDGNLTLWSDDREITELSTTGKIRGVPFDPMTFRLESGHTEKIVDHRGTQIPTIWAYPVPAEEAEKANQRQRTDEDNLMMVMKASPDASIRKWCEYLGWVGAKGQPITSRVTRSLNRLKESKHVVNERGSWMLTEKGKNTLGNKGKLSG